MERVRALQPAHKSTKVTVTAATQAFKKLKQLGVPEHGDAGKSLQHPAKSRRRLPRRGFTPLDRTEYQVVNLYQLQALGVDGPITPETLEEHGLIEHARRPVKVVGTGDLARKMDISAHKFSAAARDKIVAAGGAVHELES